MWRPQLRGYGSHQNKRSSPKPYSGPTIETRQPAADPRSIATGGEEPRNQTQLVVTYLISHRDYLKHQQKSLRRTNAALLSLSLSQILPRAVGKEDSDAAELREFPLPHEQAKLSPPGLGLPCLFLCFPSTFLFSVN